MCVWCVHIGGRFYLIGGGVGGIVSAAVIHLLIYFWNYVDVVRISIETFTEVLNSEGMNIL